jgi:hypothetical protein
MCRFTSEWQTGFKNYIQSIFGGTSKEETAPCPCTRCRYSNTIAPKAVKHLYSLIKKEIISELNFHKTAMSLSRHYFFLTFNKGRSSHVCQIRYNHVKCITDQDKGPMHS